MWKFFQMKTAIFAYFTLFSFMGFSQNLNKLSMGLNLGGHYLVSNTTHAVSANPTSHIDMNGRYMFNNRFGLKMNVGMDQFTFAHAHPKTTLFQVSLQASMNVSQLVGWHKKACRWSLFADAGLAYAAMWNKAMISGPRELFKFEKGSIDEMPQVVLGLNPQFKINERLALQANVTFNGNFMQDNGFDFASAPKDGLFSGSYTTATIGINYQFKKTIKSMERSKTKK